MHLSYRKCEQFHDVGQLTTNAFVNPVLSTRFYLLFLISGRKMGRYISLASNRWGHALKYLVGCLVFPHMMDNHWRIFKISSWGKIPLATEVNYQPTYQPSLPGFPPGLFFLGKANVPECAGRVWRANVNDTVQGGVKERKRNAWLLLTIGRCLAFVQAVQLICSCDDLFVTGSDSPISFYAYRKHAMKRLLSAAHISFLEEISLFYALNWPIPSS